MGSSHSSCAGCSLILSWAWLSSWAHLARAGHTLWCPGHMLLISATVHRQISAQAPSCWFPWKAVTGIKTHSKLQSYFLLVVSQIKLTAGIGAVC